MTHQIPADTQRLADRLRMAADEIESAARYGVPVPASVTLNGYDTLEGLTLSLDTLDEFNAWVDYASDAEVKERDHHGAHWHHGVGELGFEGLRVQFFVSTRESVSS